VIEKTDPGAPKIREPFGSHDAVQGIPANGVESFAEIKLKNSGGGRAPMTGLDNVSGINKVFCDGAARDEASLVRVDKVRDKPFKAKGEAFRVDLEAAILEGDRAEVFWFVSASFFGEKDNMGLVNGSQVGGKGVEAGESSKQIVLDEVPILLKEGGAEAIRARTGVVVHREEGVANFFQSEGANEGGGLGWGKRGGLN
jgi:hypothetical protein